MSSPATWGYALVAPGRPAEKDQVAALHEAGIPERARAPIWIDRIDKGRRGPAAGRTQLVERGTLLRGMRPGYRIIVATPYCAGLSADDVTWFLGQLADRGTSLMVIDPPMVIEPGGDVSALADEVAAAQNRAQAAASKAKAKRRSN